jgi:hypothetical protein
MEISIRSAGGCCGGFALKRRPSLHLQNWRRMVYVSCRRGTSSARRRPRLKRKVCSIKLRDQTPNCTEPVALCRLLTRPALLIIRCMLRKTAFWILLAVIVSVQALTVTCDARCESMAFASPSVAISSDSSNSISARTAAYLPPAMSLCKDLLCKDDSASITNPPAVTAAGTTQLLVQTYLLPISHNPPLCARLATHRRSSTYNPPYDPLVTILRI